MKKIILIPSYEPDNKLIELLKKINKDEFDIIIVNDGSNNKYDTIFNKAKEYSTVLGYNSNKGKGYALKYGFKYIKDNYNDNYLIITMDSDGQHKIEDAKKLANYIINNPKTLAIGMRKRGNNVPIRSKVGNSITKFIYFITTGLNIYDTQSGLRVFTNELIDTFININGERFEYEMNVLLYCAKNNIEMKEIPIETIYIENNKHSHFKTFKDSFLIYKEILKFSLSSIISFIIDYALFIILSFILNSIIISNIIARIISASTNYYLNKTIVFNNKNNKSIASYIILAIIILILNTMILNLLITKLLINKFIAKIITETILFVLSFTIQKKIVFK